MSSSDSTDPMEAYKKAMTKGSEAQKDFIRQFSNIQQDAMQNYFAVLQSLTFHNAMFKTTVQSGGRISIPEAERQALNIEDGDLVQVIVVPIERRRKGSLQMEPGLWLSACKELQDDFIKHHRLFDVWCVTAVSYHYKLPFWNFIIFSGVL
jgi:bifunctional DNA-binding transcriptional regulator/antitoxin component of YhaV-PrlF toxin-antitoxin module